MNWHDLYGMETPRSQLGMAISSGRLGHAHILAGPEGSGRRTFALMVARHRLCETARRISTMQHLPVAVPVLPANRWKQGITPIAKPGPNRKKTKNSK